MALNHGIEFVVAQLLKIPIDQYLSEKRGANPVGI
jgi:hypothetical protein